MPVVNGQLLPDYYGDAVNAFNNGRQRAVNNGLASLASDYYTQQGDPTLAGMAKLDPGAAVKFGEVKKNDKSDAEQQMVKQALLLRSVPEAMRPQMYARMLPSIRALVPEAPDQYGPDVAQTIEAISHINGGGSMDDFKPMNVSPGGEIVDPRTGRVIHANNNFAPEKPDWGYVPSPNDPNSEVYARREGNAFYDLNGNPLYGGGGGAPSAPMAAPAAPQGGGVMDSLLSLSATGAVPTSGLRSPAHNAEVGGKPNSQHLAGTAMDYKVSPQNKAAFMAMVAKNPDLMAIDEGDHIHVQQRRGAAPGTRPRYKPGAEGGQYATLTAAEVKALGLPEGTVAQRSPAGQVQIVNKPKDLPGASQTVIDNGDGTQTIIPAGKTTEDQNKAAGWYSSSMNALKNLRSVIAKDPGALFPGVIEAYSPVAEMRQRSMSPARQQAAHAFNTMKMDFLHAATGAGFTAQEAEDEWNNLAPQRGDDQPLVQQKLGQIEVKLNAMRQRAGGALPQNAPAKPQAASGGWSIKAIP